MRVRESCAVTLCLILAILISACSGADQVRGGIGGNIAAGDYHLMVHSMDNPATPPDRFTNPKPGNRFVKFDVTVSNSGQQHLPVASSHFTMRDSGGIDNSAMFGIPTDGGLRVLSLPPGQEARTTIYFEMAANQHPTELVFSPAVVGWRTRISVDL